MISTRIVYIVLLIGACLFWVMYRGALSLQLVIAAFLLPVLLFLLLLWQKRTFTVRIASNTNEATANARFQLQLRMVSRCPIPIHYVSMVLQYSHSIMGEKDAFLLQLPGMGRTPQTISLPCSVSCCGKISFRVAELRIYDPLSLFSFSVPCKDTFSLLILPPNDVPLPLNSMPDTIASETSDCFSQYQKGDDSSEIFSVDAYVNGDALSHVHWKLTAKSDEMMIKQFSLPLPDELVLFVDYRCAGTDMASAMNLHHVISVSVSMSQHLLNGGTAHHLYWQPVEAADHEAFLMDTPEQLMLSLREMLSSTPYPPKTAAVWSLEQTCATRLIYCTAILDEETVRFLSVLAMRCQILVLYICNAQPDHLPQDVNFLCCPVICTENAPTEVMQHGKETSA